MSPPPAGVNAQLRHLVHYHLDNGLLENALFFASRLHALEPRNGDAAHLLALCNLRLGRYKAAFEYAKPMGHQPPHLGCAYVFAQACLGLEQFDVGIQALEKTRGLWKGRSHWNKHSDTSRRHVPDAAAVYCLLGKLYSGHGDTKKALSLYVETLSLNPFMWDAFTALCDMRAVVRPAMVFKITPEILASISHFAPNGHVPVPSNIPDPFDSKPFVSTPDVDPFNTSIRPGADVGLNLGGSNLLSKLNSSIPATYGNGGGSSYPDVETPTSNGQGPPDEDVMMGDAGGPVMNDHTMDIPHAPSRKTRTQAVSAHEEAPRMRPITSRTRIKTTSETTERTEIPQPVGHWQNGHKRTVSGHSTQNMQQMSAQPADPTAAQPRRSARLFNSIRPSSNRLTGASSRDPEAKERRDLRKAKATGTKGKTSSTSTVGRVVSGNRKPPIEISESLKPESRPASVASMAPPLPPPKMTIPIERPREPEVLNWILELLRRVGSGYLHLSRFECVEALKHFQSISDQQRDTPWVLAQIGKAYYERSMYADAEKMFQRIRDLAPSYMEDMEVYSNTLWQLKKETELAYLAHTLVDQDRLSPQAWCALGNAFSLQREHDQAIKCFTRATQLDSKFAYAFTLQGHEHIQNEEYDKATFAYRCAVSADNTHYNGWYGLGCVYEKLGKYEVAEKHYRAAFQFNTTNPLLAVRIGTVLERMKKIEAALMQYEAAIQLDPRSTLARFRRASILLKLDSPDEALQELLYLKDAAPEDANVHFTLGRAYKKMRNRTEAIRHFTIALNLDPKAQPVIKQVMESWDDDDTWSSEDEG
ncbi:TPR-like protein [Lentithecium fluviatile CBS 122367]|uniref:TPR-like protein n=1 Tax=Lentithecium fluviatile CBS 122367 TaxID=1168545 RepID=A0A6G1IGX0_9PLEO|nr:TPR-like protein [Lentithecium fluviatile CBS 122367]